LTSTERYKNTSTITINSNTTLSRPDSGTVQYYTGNPQINGIPVTNRGDTIIVDFSPYVNSWDATSVGGTYSSTDSVQLIYYVFGKETAFGSTLSGGTLVATFANKNVAYGTGLTGKTNASFLENKFAFFSFDYEYFKVAIEVNRVVSPTAFNNVIQLKIDTNEAVVTSFNSKTSVSLDGVYINNSSAQYAKFTRNINSLGGDIRFNNIPKSDPDRHKGQIYVDSNGFLKVSKLSSMDDLYD
jgi:hypothetical protein